MSKTWGERVKRRLACLLVLPSKSFFTLMPLKAALGLFDVGAFRAEKSIGIARASIEAEASLGEKTFLSEALEHRRKLEGL